MKRSWSLSTKMIFLIASSRTHLKWHRRSLASSVCWSFSKRNARPQVRIYLAFILTYTFASSRFFPPSHSFHPPSSPQAVQLYFIITPRIITLFVCQSQGVIASPLLPAAISHTSRSTQEKWSRSGCVWVCVVPRCLFCQRLPGL